jgi:hypothetical protein
MKRIEQAIITFCIIGLIPIAANAANRTALVIGNSGYKDAPLLNPVNDATDMAATLKN